MIVANEAQLQTLRECGRRLALILEEVKKAVRPGISTKELDVLGERLILEAGGDAVFKGYRALVGEKPYPCSLCASVNDEVVHAIPSEKKILEEGDIVGLDIGMRWPSARNQQPTPPLRSGPAANTQQQGLVTDMAVTVGVGKISKKAEWLIAATREALDKGVAALRPGMRLGDLGAVIQAHLEIKGLGVIRDLAGHGTGRELHEEPFVPNYGRRGFGPPVLEGMVLALEPMAAEGDRRVVLDKDGWTFRTRDGGLAAHFEHTVIVTKDGAEVLTKM